MSVQADGPLEILGVIEGSGGFTKSGTGKLILSGSNIYEGSTTIEEGQLWVEGGLPDETQVIVKKGSYYNVYSSDEVGSIEGEGSIEIATDATLTVGGNNESTDFSGQIYGSSRGSASLMKVGSGRLTLSGSNRYLGSTTITEALWLWVVHRPFLRSLRSLS